MPYQVKSEPPADVLNAPQYAVPQQTTQAGTASQALAHQALANQLGQSNVPRNQSASLMSPGQQAQNAANPKPQAPPVDENQIDYTSACGLFGWETIDGVSIPYLMRQGKKFVAVRVVEMKLLSKFPNVYPEELTKRPPLMSYYMTSCEAKLMVEINVEHCAYEYGPASFTIQDLIVKVSEFNEFYELVRGSFSESELVKWRNGMMTGAKPGLGGWIQMNNTVVPFVCRAGLKYVPLSVIKYAANLLTNVDLKYNTHDPMDYECVFMNTSCKKAGLNFQFAKERTKLVRLSLVEALAKPKIQPLPPDNPFSHAKYTEPPRSTLPHQPVVQQPQPTQQSSQQQQTTSMPTSPNASSQRMLTTSMSATANVGNRHMQAMSSGVNFPTVSASTNQMALHRTPTVPSASSNSQQTPLKSPSQAAFQGPAYQNQTKTSHISMSPSVSLSKSSAVPQSLQHAGAVPSRASTTQFIGYQKSPQMSSAQSSTTSTRPPPNRTVPQSTASTETSTILGMGNQQYPIHSSGGAPGVMQYPTAGLMGFPGMMPFMQQQIRPGMFSMFGNFPMFQGMPPPPPYTLNQNRAAAAAAGRPTSVTTQAYMGAPQTVSKTPESSSHFNLTAKNHSNASNIPKRPSLVIGQQSTQRQQVPGGQLNRVSEPVGNMVQKPKQSIPATPAHITVNGMHGSRSQPSIGANRQLSSSGLKITLIEVGGRTLPCLVKGGDDEKYILLQDIALRYLRGCSIEEFQFVLEHVLEVNVMQCSSAVEKVFMQAYNHPQPLPNTCMIKFSDFKTYLPQLKYILKSKIAVDDDNSESAYQQTSPRAQSMALGSESVIIADTNAHLSNKRPAADDIEGPPAKKGKGSLDNAINKLMQQKEDIEKVSMPMRYTSPHKECSIHVIDRQRGDEASALQAQSPLPSVLANVTRSHNPTISMQEDGPDPVIICLD